MKRKINGEHPVLSHFQERPKLFYSMCICVHVLAAKSLQSCLTLSDPMDCSPPGSSILGIFWATVLEWGAIAFSRACAQSYPTLCDPMDCSPPCSSIYGIFQAIILEWIAISHSNFYSISITNFFTIQLECHLFSITKCVTTILHKLPVLAGS